MPRFPDESVTCLKRTMLARQPHFMFTTSDVENVMKETGLNSAQVWMWAEKFRFHNETEKARKDFLESDGIGKVRDCFHLWGRKYFRPQDLFLTFSCFYRQIP